MSAFDDPRAGDVFVGVGLAFEAQVRAAFSRLPRKMRLNSVRMVPSSGAAVTWTPQEPAIGGQSKVGYDVTLLLPAVNPDDPMSRREANCFAAYAVHELCHVLLTDLVAFEQYARRGPMHKHVLNGLEDARIERTVIRSRIIPGARALLLPLSEYLVDKSGADFGAAVAADKLSAVPFALALYCREYGIAEVDTVTARAGKRIAAALAIGVKAVRAATCTADLVPAADAILALFPKAAAVPTPKAPAGKDSDAGEQGEQEGDGGDGDADAMPGDDEAGEAPGEQGDAGDAGDDQGDADGADGAGDAGDDPAGEDGAGDSEAGEAGDSDADAEGDAGDADAEGDADADAEGDGAGEDTGGDDGEAGDAGGQGGDAGGTGGDDWDSAAGEIDAGPLNPEPARAAEELAKDVSGEQAATYEGELLSQLAPIAFKKLRASNADPADVQRWAHRALAAGKASAVTQAKLARALRSPRISWATKKLTAGRIDPTRLPRVGVDDPAVFIRRGETAGTETALTVLVDASGSMSGAKARQAAAAAYSLAATFTAMRLPCEVAIFKAANDGDVILCAKERDATLRKSAAHICEMQRRASGGTPDTEALAYYVRKMARWIEARRVLLVITDGAGNLSQERHNQALAEARRLGVQVFGIGIGIPDYALEARYPGCAVAVEELKDLPEALAKVLTKAAAEWERARAAA